MQSSLPAAVASDSPRTVFAAGLVKEYANGVKAIRGVSLHAEEAEIIGVVGPNGAGKSTTLNVLATLIRRTGGVAEICGSSVDDRRRVREVTGVALQEAGLDPLMTAKDHFDVQGALYHVDPRELAARRSRLLAQFELSAVAHRSVGVFSGGMQRRLALALALVNEPRVVIFDEPTSGLDPSSRRVVWRCIAELREQRRTVVFSTHYLEEAQELCDRVYLIFDGKVVREGTPDTVRQGAGVALLQFTVDGAREKVTETLKAFTANGLVGSRIVTDDPLTVELNLTTDGPGVTERILAAMRLQRLEIRDLRLASPSLEDAFLAIVDDLPHQEALTGSPIESAARKARGGKHWR